MLSGRFEKIVVNFERIDDVLSEVNEGYLKVAWREKDLLKTGYLLIRRGSVRGAFVEEIMSRGKIFGEIAVKEIIEAFSKKRIHVIEVYNATLEEFLRENPEVIIKVSSLQNESLNLNLDSLLHALTSHQGEIIVHNGSTSWSLNVDRGKVRAARTIKGAKLKGTIALKSMLLEIGDIVKNGTYELGKNTEFLENEVVDDENTLIDGLKLLQEKIKFENKKLF